MREISFRVWGEPEEQIQIHSSIHMSAICTKILGCVVKGWRFSWLACSDVSGAGLLARWGVSWKIWFQSYCRLMCFQYFLSSVQIRKSELVRAHDSSERLVVRLKCETLSNLPDSQCPKISIHTLSLIWILDESTRFAVQNSGQATISFSSQAKSLIFVTHWTKWKDEVYGVCDLYSAGNGLRRSHPSALGRGQRQG